ncbi:MAG: Asp-tRNA(Asn)/Glu-tRNA(Gln) amidotransferase subunit GatA [Candidatus Pacebacteria bacterium]|nr:Asp-tRNA(Asn)/Glu-tRNA(Gln) amidotransferase subunit GatA [Candidatus Paceibacterota bacterium]
MSLASLSITEAHTKLVAREISVHDLVSACLQEIETHNPDVHAYLEIYPDVVEQTERAQKMYDDGTATMLTGIPVALKDNMLRKGFIASASSKILENYRASYSATVVQKLSEQGVVFLGRTNMDEFAMGSSTENSAYGMTKNPLDTSRVPGGSSGGSAASVAMNGALCALGSDTGGSIRQPAAFCGLVGLKPTYGAVSRYGLMAMSSSLDEIGPLTKTVTDSEILFDAIKGVDPMDATTTPTEMREQKKSSHKKIGVPWSWVQNEGVSPQILENFNATLEHLKKEGYEIVDIDLPYSKHSLSVYYIIQPAEVSSNLARFDGIRYGVRQTGENLMDVYMKSRGKGLGHEVRRRVLLGTYILSHGHKDAYYNKAIAVATLIRKECESVFSIVDAIATPTSPFLAFEVGERSDNPMAMYMSDLFTVPANIAGLPSLAVPSGTAGEKLRHSIQFTGPRYSEKQLFTLGKIITEE